MHKGIHNNKQHLKFNPIDIKKKPEEQKEKQYSNSKDYDSIRKLVNETHKPMKNKYYLIYKI